MNRKLERQINTGQLKQAVYILWREVFFVLFCLFFFSNDLFSQSREIEMKQRSRRVKINFMLHLKKKKKKNHEYTFRVQVRFFYFFAL